MNLNKYKSSIVINSDFSINDWNQLINDVFRKYFLTQNSIDNNRWLLRTEIINYVMLENDPVYRDLFDTTHNFYRDFFRTDYDFTFNYFNDSLNLINKTDSTWMSLYNTQVIITELCETDRIDYLFQQIDSILEKVLRPRLLHLYYLGLYKKSGNKIVDSELSFGNLIDNFPISFSSCELYLSDPINHIKTSQWRNIAAHKSYSIKNNEIHISYGNKLQHHIIISFNDLQNVVNWIQGIYRALRLSQVLLYLEYIPEIRKNLRLKCDTTVRYDSCMITLLHNMAIAGFEFTNQVVGINKIFFDFIKNPNEDIKTSIIHSSQCFDKIAFALDNDPFMKGKYKSICIRNISPINKKVLSVAEADISDIIDFLEKKIDQVKFCNLIYFDIDGLIIEKENH